MEQTENPEIKAINPDNNKIKPAFRVLLKNTKIIPIKNKTTPNNISIIPKPAYFGIIML